jgi:hypothetical protein
VTDWEARARRDTTRSLVLASAAVGLIGWVFIVVWREPDRWPFVFAFTLSWLLMTAIGLMTAAPYERADLSRWRWAPWERQGRVYERLGVRGYRWALLHSPFGWCNPHLSVRGGRADLERLERDMLAAEGPHAISMVVTFAVAIGFAWTGHAWVAVWMAVVNVPLNVYPVMLQRWNRGRVRRLRGRLGAA